MPDMKLSDPLFAEATSTTATDRIYLGTGIGGSPASKFIKVPNLVGTLISPIIVTSASAAAIVVGRQGTTSPAFQVDASAATSVTGVKITAAAAAGGAALAAISSGAAENLTIDAKGTGHLILQSSATGNVGIATFTPAGLINTLNTSVLAIRGTLPGIQIGRGTGYLSCEFSATASGVYWDVAGSASAASNILVIRMGQTNSAYTIAEALRITSALNVGLATTTFGTSATKTFAISTGVAPSTSPADAFQMYCADQTAGNACAHFRSELGGIIKLYQQAFIASPAADAAALKTAIDSIRTVLINNGLTAAA